MKPCALTIVLLLVAGSHAAAGDPKADPPPPYFGYTERTESGIPVFLILVPGSGERREAVYAESLHESDVILRTYGRGVSNSHVVALTATRTVPFLILADGNPVDARWLKPFTDEVRVIVMKRTSPPLRVAEKFAIGSPPSFGLIDEAGALRLVQATERRVNDEVSIVRKDRTDKETWKRSAFSLSYVPIAETAWQSPAKKSVAAPKGPASVIIPTAGQDLDPLWRSMLRPEAAIAILPATK